MSWRLPAEWELHRACWIIWPCRMEIWCDYTAACHSYAAVINSIANVEAVNLIVPPQFLTLVKRLCTTQNVTILNFPVDDSWSRDTMPLFFSNGSVLSALHCQFNAWGEKFHPYAADAKLKDKVSQYLNLKSVNSSLVLEGGAIHCNGQQTLLTSSQCLLHANRNPHLSPQQIEELLLQHLQQQKIIWLAQGLAGDCDTDGHVDNIACFIKPHEIVIQACNSADDANYGNFKVNRDILQQSCDNRGQAFTLHEIAQPTARYHQGKRLPLSYINFYFANHAIIMPSFRDPRYDDKARGILSELCIDREIFQIDALPLVLGGGGIHCITMQQPEVTIDANH